MAVYTGAKARVDICGTPLTLTNEATSTSDLTTYQITAVAKRIVNKLYAITVETAWDDIQTVSLTGSPTGGTFTLTFGANTTAGIPWNATAAQVQAALELLASIGTGNVLVTGGPGPSVAWVCEFRGTLGLAPQAVMTGSGALLTPSGGVNIAHTLTGQVWTAVTDYTMRYLAGKVIFNTARGAGTQARISGQYLPTTIVAEATDWQLSIELDLVKTTTLGSEWREQEGVQRGGSIKFARWWVDQTFYTKLTDGAMTVVTLYVDKDTLSGFRAFGNYKTDAMKVENASPESEDVTFEAHGEAIFYP